MSCRSFLFDVSIFKASPTRTMCGITLKRCDNDAIIMCWRFVSVKSRRWCIMWNFLTLFPSSQFSLSTTAKIICLFSHGSITVTTFWIAFRNWFERIYLMSNQFVPWGLVSFWPQIPQVFRFKDLDFLVNFTRGLSHKRRLNQNEIFDSKITHIRITVPAAAHF